MEYAFTVGSIVKLKKAHPCGSQEWEILRVGADFRLKCMGCGHQIMVPRKMVAKNARGLRQNPGKCAEPTTESTGVNPAGSTGRDS